MKMNQFLRRAIQGEDEWSEMNALQKFLYIVLDIPWDFLRRITIAPCHEEMWYRKFAVVWPVPAIVFIYLTNGWIPFDGSAFPISFWILLAIAFVSSFVFYFTTHPTNPPKFILLFALCGFLVAIFWVNWISNILIDVLGLLGLMFNIPTSYLGLTILAWGNSVGDTITNASVAKRGLAKMAITGCFAGQFFNLSLGLGISMLKENLVTGQMPDFAFGENQALLPLIITFPLMVALIAVMVLTTINKFELKKWQGYIQMAWWLLVFIITTIAAFGFPNAAF